MGNTGWSSQDFVTGSSQLHQALTYLKAEIQYVEASSLLDYYGMLAVYLPVWHSALHPMAVGAISAHRLQAHKSFGQGFLELPPTGISPWSPREGDGGKAHGQDCNSASFKSFKPLQLL